MALVSNSTWTGKLVDGQPEDPAVIDAALEALRTGVNDIDTNQINANANIAGSKLAAGSVTALQLAGSSVGSSELKTDAVIEAKILNGAVTSAKLGSLSILDTHLNWSGGGSEVSALRAWQSQRHVLYGVETVGTHTQGQAVGGGTANTIGVINFINALNYDGTHTFATANSVVVTTALLTPTHGTNDIFSVVVKVINETTATYTVHSLGTDATVYSDVKLHWVAIGDWA